MPITSRIGVTDEEYNKRLSCSSISFSPFQDGFPRLSFSYQKLPTHFIKLSVLKLDGTSFDVQVVGTATVGELKQAVEDLFDHSPKEGEAKISWSHVWSHFCLCYGNQKLVNDKDYIRNFGIRDGDQLHFIRHLSINYKVIKRRPKKESAICEEQPISCPGSSVCEEKEESINPYVKGDLEEGYTLIQYENGGDTEFIGHPEFKLSHFVKGMLSHSRMWFVGKSKSDHRIQPSRFSGRFLEMGSKTTLTPL